MGVMGSSLSSLANGEYVNDAGFSDPYPRLGAISYEAD